MLQYTRLEKPAKNKLTSLLGPLISYEEKISVVPMATWSVNIHKTTFSSSLTKRSNMLGCLSVANLSGLVHRNTSSLVPFIRKIENVEL